MRKRSEILCGAVLLAMLAGCTAKESAGEQGGVPEASPAVTKSIESDAQKTGEPEDANAEQSGQQGEDAQQPEVTQAVPQPTEAPVERDYVVNKYPTVYADVPDPDMIRVGENYYMVSTTMNMCPGVPVMKSVDLVNWEIVNYVYETFEDDDVTNLENGRDMYAHGSWAASLKYDEVSGKYYVAFNSNDHGFYIYTTADIENGVWEKYFCARGFHDPALFFEAGNMYVISASGGNCSIQQLELDEENGAVREIGSSKRLFQASGWSLWEGAHAYKVDDYYYIFIIASPQNRWMRTQLCYRSRNLFDGEWEEKVVYQAGCGGNNAGLAQGGILQTQHGDWYAFLFQDCGAVGRVPSILAVDWQDGWPMMGTYDVEGKFHASADYISKIYLKAGEKGSLITDNDEFVYSEGEALKKVWQWNHNPQNDYWSVTAHEGYLRLTADRAADNIWYAHNSLTQRTYGPTCQSEVKLLTDGMKPGEYAGICAVADACGMVGVLCDDNGDRYIYQAEAEFRAGFEQPNEVLPEKLAQGQEVRLKIAYDFKADTAEFFYSLDGENWNTIGTKKKLGFSTSTTFMGTRTWLYNYATGEAGGYVDFDYYHIYH